MNRQPTYQDFVDEQRHGKIHGVFIDETGSPGLKNTPTNLHPDRKTWVAVIVPKTQIAEVWQQFPGALAELNKLYAVNEFHFSDIYMGRKAFKGVPFKERLALFKFMAEIFSTYNFPVFVQTLDPNSIKDVRCREELPKSFGPFNFEKPEDLGLYFLLFRVKEHLKTTYKQGEHVARVFIDEGNKKNGAGLCMPWFNEFFADGLILFSRSDVILPIQLADFAAYCLNRTQLIIGREEITDEDFQLLQAIEPMVSNFKNIQKGLGNLQFINR